MQKKFILSILLSFIILTLSACGNDANSSELSAAPETVVSNTPTVTQSATVSATPVPTDIPVTPEPTITVEPTPEISPEEAKYLAAAKETADILTASPHNIFSFFPEKQNQVVDGFGASYTWYADWVNFCDDQEEFFDTLFADAKMTILRFKNEYEYYGEDFASNAETMARYYNEAAERAAKYGEKPIVLMSCWSPKHSLKENGDITGKASLKKDENGNYCYEEYADWWVESIKYYESFGFKVDYVAIQNEVEFPADYDGCTFATTETETQASFAKAYLAVYYAFREAFGDDAPKMLGPETMSCKPMTISSYMKEIIKTEPDSVHGIAHHLYVGVDGNGNEVDPDSGITNLSSINTYFSKYKKWQTEYYIGHALDTAQLINNCMIFENLNAYVYWGGVWTDDGVYSFENGKLIAVAFEKEKRHTDNGWYLCGDYYALRHFSEFVRPGYIRVNAATHSATVKSSAYLSPDNSKAAVVLINTADTDTTFSISGEGYIITDSRIYQSVFGDTCESPEQCFIDKGSLGKYYEVTLPAKSVTTIDITGYYK